MGVLEHNGLFFRTSSDRFGNTALRLHLAHTALDSWSTDAGYWLDQLQAAMRYFRSETGEVVGCVKHGGIEERVLLRIQGSDIMCRCGTTPHVAAHWAKSNGNGAHEDCAWRQ